MRYSLKVSPGEKVRLEDHDPNDTGGLTREEGSLLFQELSHELEELQAQLYGARTHSVLLILQGLDASGKDGAIRRALVNLSPLGCRASAFKAPTEEELAHDFLWRIHRLAPAKGILGVFNRSHYEDIVAVRVRKLAPPEVWKARYQQINDFEQLLAAGNMLIVKLFLHISKKEQEERLLAREKDINKAWKLAPEDWKERDLWDDFVPAYEDVFHLCSTSIAPWYIVPANKKWYRNLAVCEALVETMRPHRTDWRQKLEEINRKVVPEVEAVRNSREDQ